MGGESSLLNAFRASRGDGDGERHPSLQDLNEDSWEVMPNPFLRDSIDHARAANGYSCECLGQPRSHRALRSLGWRALSSWPAGWYAVRASMNMASRTVPWSCAERIFRTPTFQGGTEGSRLFSAMGLVSVLTRWVPGRCCSAARIWHCRRWHGRMRVPHWRTQS